MKRESINSWLDAALVRTVSEETDKSLGKCLPLCPLSGPWCKTASSHSSHSLTLPHKASPDISTYSSETPQSAWGAFHSKLSPCQKNILTLGCAGNVCFFSLFFSPWKASEKRGNKNPLKITVKVIISHCPKLQVEIKPQKEQFPNAASDNGWLFLFIQGSGEALALFAGMYEEELLTTS